ncbi:hypothetical protein ScPMuIL_003112 [Solemya velum]
MEKLAWNRQLEKHVISRCIGNSFLKCAKLCSRTDGCESFTFRQKLLSCSLHDVHAVEDDLVEKFGSVYGAMTDWDELINKEIFNTCSSSECEHTSICLSGCGFPPYLEHGSIKDANPENVSYVCDNGYVMVEINVDAGMGTALQEAFFTCEGIDKQWEGPVIQCLMMASSDVCYEYHKDRQYSGTVNVTEFGNPCQYWDLETPHSHDYRGVHFIENYCRASLGWPRPWCYLAYVAFPRWEYCDIPRCENDTDPTDSCYDEVVDPYVAMYNVRESETGKPCLDWALFSSPDNDNLHYESILENRCSVTNGNTRPWCFVTQTRPASWEFCDFPRCEYCGDPPALENATVSPGTNTAYSIRRYTCTNGKVGLTVCQPNRTWTEINVTCS